MLHVARKNDDKSFYRRLNPISNADDVVANDAKYQLMCWVLMKRTVQQKDKSIETQEIEDIHYVIADIEIINIVKAELGDPSQKIVNIKKKRYAL